MYREVATIKDDNNNDVILAVEFGHFEEPISIQPMTNGGHVFGEEFPFDYECTKGSSLQARSNRAVFNAIYGSSVRAPHEFMPILLMVE